MQESTGVGGGASRTFHSIFGAAAHPPHDDDDDDAVMEVDDTNSDLLKRIRDIQKHGRHEENADADLWDDDFPSDSNEDNNELDTTAKQPTPRQPTLADGYGRSMEDWADDDEEEEGWKDALQSRVDQLELVVEKKVEPPPPPPRIASGSGMGAPPPPILRYTPPVDQRATLTLLPKTNLTRSVSDSVTGVEEKRASKLKALTVARAASGVSATTTKSMAAATKQPVEQRKRSNSRDLTSRQPLTAEHKRLSKSTSATAAAGANSVFVRAVVARGSNAVARHHEPRLSDEGHVDKRSKSDEREIMLALGDAEAVRRYILHDVKKMSVERIVSDATRLHFLEDFYRRHPDASEKKTGTTTATTGRHASPTKKRAI